MKYKLGKPFDEDYLYWLLRSHFATQVEAELQNDLYMDLHWNLASFLHWKLRWNIKEIV
jgi:hypothetical protein